MIILMRRRSRHGSPSRVIEMLAWAREGTVGRSRAGLHRLLASTLRTGQSKGPEREML